MIDYREIYNTFIQVASYAVGDKLSRTGETGETPAVIKARESQRTPEYPFITVNLRDTGNTTKHPVSEYTDTSGNTVVIYHRRMFLTYRVYGDDTQEITSAIIERLHTEISSKYRDKKYLGYSYFTNSWEY